MAGCQTSCHGNCSCLAMFFHRSSGNGFFLDSVGSFQKPASDPGYVSYIKVSSEGGSGSGFGGGGSGNKHTVVVVIIVLVTFFVICGLVFWGVRYQGRKQRVPESPSDGSEEANFLENLTDQHIFICLKHSASSGVWDDEVAGEADGVVVQMGIAEKLQRARG
ncbi:uncharacterized protein HKW66_Vig0104650 [Vigna angularis]|uniref:Apple domain-containing protein n=1 Tax=Phaseolus angularis TaxID=3914 RepID=A0A8T0KKX3_PHAAN|nr:uncharacterized protein HKW66_Vig0104650 [Vigna angularis]